MCLAVEAGGYPFLLPNHLGPRYTVHHDDVTTYDLFSERRGWTTPFPLGGFDLVILDAHALHARPFELNTSLILLLSQLLVGLKAVKTGGTLLLTLTKLAGPISARILLLLDSISNSLQTVKPHTSRGARSTFYAVAKGIGRGPLVTKAVEKLRVARAHLENDPDCVWDEVWDAVVPVKDIKAKYIERLTDLGLPVWSVQKAHLERFLIKAGVLKRVRVTVAGRLPESSGSSESRGLTDDEDK